MADDMSAIAAPDTPSAVDMALAGGPAMGGTPDPNAPVPMMQPPQAPAQAAAQVPNPSSGTASSVLSNPNATPAQPAQQMPPLPEETQQHMGLLHRILDKVGTILGGDETLHVTKDVDGNITMTKDPSTTGEKWGRIAQAALTGAGVGFANSQGPGGMAKAAGAGIQAGLKLPQQNQEQVQQEVSAEQQTQLRNAQKALTQQQIAQNAFNMKERGVALTGAQSDRANQVQSWILGNSSNKKIGDFSNMQDVIDYENTHGDLIKGHTNGMFHTEVMGDGKVRLFTVDQAWLDQKNDKDMTVKRLESGDTADAPMKLVDYTIPAGSMTNRDIAQFQEAQTAKISKYQLDISGQQEKAQASKDAVEQRADAARDRSMYQGTMAQIAQENAETRRMMANNAGGGGAPGGGLHGDAYLATIPDNVREHVKSIARGDTKMPSGARSGQVQALRNMVFNYDPTYTDARYDTMQNFKTKGDSTNLVQLSTALEHVENAQVHSKQVGFAPLLSRNATASDAAYNQDLKFFTQEAGKLVKNGVLGEAEYEDLKSGMSSSRQSIRDSAINETVKLLGGKVAGTFQKFKAGAGKDIPVEDFFDQPTQQRLQRYGMTPQPIGAPNPQSSTGQTFDVPAGGKTYHFQTQQQADDFKKKAGINQ